MHACSLSFFCEAGGVFCDMLGVCHRYTETLGSTAAHTHTSYTMRVRPPSFEVVCIREWTYFECAVLYPWLSPENPNGSFGLAPALTSHSRNLITPHRTSAEERVSWCLAGFYSRCSLALTKPKQKFPWQQTRDVLVNLRFSLRRTSLSQRTNSTYFENCCVLLRSRNTL